MSAFEQLKDIMASTLQVAPDVITETVTMDDYKNWAAYGNWRALNVQGMARYLRQTGKAN